MGPVLMPGAIRKSGQSGPFFVGGKGLVGRGWWGVDELGPLEPVHWGLFIGACSLECVQWECPLG